MPDRATALAERVAARDRRALARALTLVENRRDGFRELLAALYDRARPALRVGFTGAPGVGKSALIDAVAKRLAEQGRNVAALVVDPSSPFTGGAMLGDRVRMSELDAGGRVYIRSTASRGALGGLGAAAADLLTTLEAAAFDVILVETVGTGQAEVDVARLTSPTVLVLAPGMGDEIQALKAGVMEVADILVLNKADLPGADRAEAQLLAALELRPEEVGPAPPVLRTAALERRGLEKLLAAIDAASDRTRPPEAYWRERLRADLREGLLEAAGLGERLEAVVREVASGRRNPYRAVDELLGAGVAVDHIGVAVRSIDQALGLWARVLGVEGVHRVTVEREGIEAAMLPLGACRIELLEPTAADSPVGRFLAKRGEGLHHIAVRVDDLEDALRRFDEQGLTLVDEEPRIGAEGYRYVFVHPRAANGVLLELVAAR